MFERLLPSIRGRSLAKGPMDAMEEFWKNAWGSLPSKEMGFPAVDLSEDENQITVTAEIPGIDPKDVDVTIDKGMLSIKGEKKFEHEEKKDNFHRIERSYGSFYRTVQLPAAVKEDEVKARYKDGVLQLTLPKATPSTAKKIEIET